MFDKLHYYPELQVDNLCPPQTGGGNAVKQTSMVQYFMRITFIYLASNTYRVPLSLISQSALYCKEKH